MVAQTTRKPCLRCEGWMHLMASGQSTVEFFCCLSCGHEDYGEPQDDKKPWLETQAGRLWKERHLKKWK